MREYDIYLNGIGYALAKDSQGRLLSGAAREQAVDPFTAQLARDEPYTRMPFRFGDGAGLHHYDGSNRYEWGSGIDTRSGALILAPERFQTGEPWKNQKVLHTTNLAAEQMDNGGTQWGLAEKYYMAAPRTTIRSVILLMKRSMTIDYTDAGTFAVAIAQDDANKPGTNIQTKTVSMKSESFYNACPFADRWRYGDWFWLEVVFDADAVVGSGNYFWVAVYNNNSQPIYWADDADGGLGSIRSVHNGTAWQTGVSDSDDLFIKIGHKDGWDQFDSFPLSFCVYRGTDEIERIYAGTRYRVLYWNAAWSAGHWWESKTIGAPVVQLLEYANKMFAACGPNTDYWYSDGSDPGATAWTQVTGYQSNAFAVHDNLLWKADLHKVCGSVTGTGGWLTECEVGDPGTAVHSMVSHGGKLFVAKPEGIFEISYPEDYTTSGKPVANLMLDFSTERCARTWLLDWHSGLYFPGLGGVYEFKNGVLRNIWEDKIDEGATEITRGTIYRGEPSEAARTWPYAPPYIRTRSWAPLYDHDPVVWTAAWATTRGIVFVRANPYIETSELIWWDGRGWHSLRAAQSTDSYGNPVCLAEYITAVAVQDAGGGRGWMWYNEGTGIARTEWPNWTDNTADDTSVEYEIDGAAITPWFSLPSPSQEMLLAKVGILSRQLRKPPLTYSYVYLYYRTDTQNDWTYIGTIFDTSPYQEVSFSTPISCRRAQFKLVLLTGDPTYTPIIEQMDIFYQTLPDPSRTHQLIISCAGDQARRVGGLDKRTAGETLQDLRDLVGETSLAYTDLLGSTHVVRVTAMTAQYMNLLTGPGPEGIGVDVQVILNLLEVM